MAVPAIIVHGGAAPNIPDEFITGLREGTKKAARAGYHVLKEGGSSTDAVEAAVCVLEDDPTFNAGYGSVLTSDGDIEMDAAVMDGRTLNAGGITCVRGIKNPIKLARHVMEKTNHCLLDGKGAIRFAVENGISTVPMESLVSEKAKRRLAALKESNVKVENDESSQSRTEEEHDTVGAVAIDCYGNIACGTSTGGITGKMEGRIGDVPIIGAGGYADNEVGGVSCTGYGESIYKVLLAYQIMSLMRQGLSGTQATEQALANMVQRVGGFGGVIVIDKHSTIAKAHTTDRMAWAWIKEDVLHYGVNKGEDLSEPTS